MESFVISARWFPKPRCRPSKLLKSRNNTQS